MGRKKNIFELPILVLKAKTVFPNMVVGFDISKKRTINAVKEAMLKDQLVFLCVQKNLIAEIPTEDDIYKFGVIGKIRQSLNTNDEQMKIMFEPTHRARLIELMDNSEYLYGKIEKFEEEHIYDTTTEAYVRSINTILPKYFALRGASADRLLKDINQADDYNRFSNFICGILNLRNDVSQKLLEELDLNKRLELIYNSIINEMEVLKIKREINEKYKENVVEYEKKFFLKNQLEYIKSELNMTSDEGDEAEQFKAKLKELSLPEAINDKLLKEIKRYSNMNPHSSELSNMSAYLTRVLELPWNEQSEESLIISKAKEILDQDHYGLLPFQANKIAFNLGLEGQANKEFKKFITALYNAYIGIDASLFEINPVLKTSDDKIIAVDAKVTLDGNALYRHKDLAELRDKREEDPMDVEAGEAGLNFVKLDGDVACMVNGAGLAMATMDMIKLSGGNPANFLDVGGTADAARVKTAFEIILKDENVKAILINIFGGIVRCDRVAQGVVDAYKQFGNFPVPLIVRLQGTNAEEAKKLIDEAGLPIHSAITLEEAANKVKEVLA